MPSFTHELHVKEPFEDYGAGDVIADQAVIGALWLGPHTDKLELRKAFIVEPAGQTPE